MKSAHQRTVDGMAAAAGRIGEELARAKDNIACSAADTREDLAAELRRLRKDLTAMQETIVGFGISVAFAVVTALVMDSVGWIRRALYPILVTSQTIPIVAVAPLLVIWFGPLGLLPKITVVVLVTFFPVTVALLDGLAGTDRDAMSLLQTMGASRSQILFKLRLPGALPAFFTGLRIAVTYAVIGAIFGEQVGAVNGLGIWMILSKNLFRTDLVFGAILITAVLTLSLWLLVGLAERLTIPWYRAARRIEG